jgi:transposase
MLKKPEPMQYEIEMVCIEQLVPQDHLLRKIDKHIKFDFIYEKMKKLYCENNGRPAIDPVVLFKMLLIGYLFGIRSERQLIKEIEVNIAYRWFLELKINDKIPDHSTISQNRRRRFLKGDIFQEIFDEIVMQAYQKGLIEGKVLYSDSTFLKANANRNKFIRKEVEKSTKYYMDELEKAIDEDREEHGRSPLKEKAEKKEIKETRVSTTDPESGYMRREGKPEGFFYLDHRTVDGKLNMITDVFVTPGNVHDSVPYLSRIDRQKERFGFDIKAAGLDAGYMTAGICHGLEKRGIFGAIAYRTPNHIPGTFYKREFKYNAEADCYECPNLHLLKYRTTTREGYREYASDPNICRNCPGLDKCTKSKNCTKVVTRHVWESDKEKIRQNRLSEKGKKIYERRKETIERSFADAKELHGYRYARFRGLSRVRMQCLMTAVCQNIKKMALHLSGNGGTGDNILEILWLSVFNRFKASFLFC